jgi:hypothetical protein
MASNKERAGLRIIRVESAKNSKEFKFRIEYRPIREKNWKATIYAYNTLPEAEAHLDKYMNPKKDVSEHASYKTKMRTEFYE